MLHEIFDARNPEYRTPAVTVIARPSHSLCLRQVFPQQTVTEPSCRCYGAAALCLRWKASSIDARSAHARNMGPFRVDLSSQERSLQAPLVDPPGFDKGHAMALLGAPVVDATGAVATRRKEEECALKQAHAWAIAKSPAGQLPMMFFMMWMAGNSIQIFSIMITGTNLVQVVRAIMSSRATFERLADKGVDTTTPRVLFIALHSVVLLYALYKLDKMGLLPTHVSDWLPHIPPPQQLESSSMGIPL